MRQETAARAAAMRSHFGPARKRVYANKSLSIQTRRSLSETLCHTRLFHNAGTWNRLEAADRTRMRTAYMQVMRCVAGMAHHAASERHWTDDQVAVHSEQGTVEDKMLEARVRYYVRFAVKAPRSLRQMAAAAAAAPRSWMSQLQDDLGRLMALEPEPLSDLPHPCNGTDKTLACMAERPGVRRSRLLRAVRRHPQIGCAATAPKAAIDLDSSCEACGMAFSSRSALYTHMHNKHGWVNLFRARIDTTVCKACGTDFHSLRRCFQHVRGDQRRGVGACGWWYLEHVPKLPQERLGEITAQARAMAPSSKEVRLPPVPAAPT